MWRVPYACVAVLLIGTLSTGLSVLESKLLADMSVHVVDLDMVGVGCIVLLLLLLHRPCYGEHDTRNTCALWCWCIMLCYRWRHWASNRSSTVSSISGPEWTPSITGSSNMWWLQCSPCQSV